jgi:hypothetical protein
MTKTRRTMSEGEREQLRQILKMSPSGASRWMKGAVNALVGWAVLMMVFVVAWKFIAWVARATFHVQIGWDSPVALWIAGSGILACALYAVVESVRWVLKWPDSRREVRDDLEGGLVIEESYEFTAARRFQEPEHGGLFYFLRTTDDKVFVLYDEESQALGARGENPLTSPFRPCRELLLVRAPKTRFVIGQQFSGAVLDAGDPHELSIGPDAWPESEEFCKVRWDALDSRFGGKRKRK